MSYLNISESLKIYLKPKILQVTFYGFVNGLLLLLSGNTLNFWLTKQGIDIKTIGLFSLVALPYATKYAFAPLIDRYKLPILSKYFEKRKAWIILSLVKLTILLALVANLEPSKDIYLIAILIFFVSLFSANIDIALNSYRIESVEKKYVPYSSASYMFGYKIGMITSGAGAIFLSSFVSWGTIYFIASVLTFLFLILFLFLEDNFSKKDNHQTSNKNWVYKSFIEPFEHFGNLSNLLLVILFLVLYRISDDMIFVMLNPLLIQLNFNEIEIASAGKFFGITSSLFGGLIASLLSTKINIKQSLFYFGLIHILTHFLYFPLIYFGHNITMLFVTAGFEAFTGGMTMATYISYITSLCKGRNIGTQYALLFSVMGISRVIFPSVSGYIISYAGWYNFFIITIIISFPALFLINKLKK